MKKIKKLDKLKKVILIILCAITVFFSMPVKSEAGIGEDIVDFILKLPDAVMRVLNNHVSERGGKDRIQINLKGWDSKGWIYNFEVTPYDIFTSGLEYNPPVDYSGNIDENVILTKLPLLDINFFEEKDNSTSGASTNSSIILAPVISQVYRTLRDLVLIVMLVVLLYVGIRIIIASAVSDQVKYKQWIMDWVVGICLVVLLQYIMSFMMNMNEIIVRMLGENKEASYYISLASLGSGGGYSAWGDEFNGVKEAAEDNEKIKKLYIDHLDVHGNDEHFNYNESESTISGIERVDWPDTVFINARITDGEGNDPDKTVYMCNIVEYVRTITTFGTDLTTEYKPSSKGEGIVANPSHEVSSDSTGDTDTTVLNASPEFYGYAILYVLLVVETLMFLYTYIKRVFKLAFYTMIAPLIAFMYPIDKLGDGKAQAFNTWFKEYLYNVLIQPLHLLLYTIFIYSAMALMHESIIYALGAYAYMIAAEKFFKKIFGFDKAPSGGPGGLGNNLAGAAAMGGLGKAMGGLGKGKDKKSGKDSSGGNSGKIKFHKPKNRTPSGDGRGPTPSGDGRGPTPSGDGGPTPSGNGGGKWNNFINNTAPGRFLKGQGLQIKGAASQVGSNIASTITGNQAQRLKDVRAGQVLATGAKGGAKFAARMATAGAGAFVGTIGGAVAGLAASAFTGEDKMMDSLKTGFVGGAVGGYALGGKFTDAIGNLSEAGKAYRAENDKEYATQLQMRELQSAYPEIFDDMDSSQKDAMADALYAIEDDITDEKDLKQIKNMVSQGISGEEIAEMREDSNTFGDLTSKSNMESFVKYYESQNVDTSQATTDEQRLARQEADKQAKADKEKAVKEAQSKLDEIDEKRRKDLAFARMSGESEAEVKRKWRDKQTQAQNALNAANNMSETASDDVYQTYLKQKVIEGKARRTRNYQQKKKIND